MILSDIGAHPRVSGENACRNPPTPQVPGSSPRERGKLVRAALLTLQAGLIPA